LLDHFMFQVIEKVTVRRRGIVSGSSV